MTYYYAWSADVLVPGQGLMDARGVCESDRIATELELKAVAAREAGVEHSVDPGKIRVFAFTYSTIPSGDGGDR